MTEHEFKEIKNLLRYQCKALDSIKVDIGQQAETTQFLLEDARLERTTLEIMRSHTRSVALNVRGVMLILRVVTWLLGLHFGLSGLLVLAAGLTGSAGDGMELVALILGTILLALAGVAIKVAITAFGEQGEADTPLK